MTAPLVPETQPGAPNRVDELVDELADLVNRLQSTVERLKDHAAAAAQTPEVATMPSPDSSDAQSTENAALQVSVEGLEQRVGELQGATLGIGRQLRRRTIVVAACMLLIVIVLASTVPAMVVVSLNNREAIIANNQRFCPLLAVFIVQKGEPLPETARGRKVAHDAAELYGGPSFNCGDPTKLPPAGPLLPPASPSGQPTGS